MISSYKSKTVCPECLTESAIPYFSKPNKSYMRNLDRFILLLFISCLLIFSGNSLHAQQPNFQIVKGLPTNEVYDLLIDSKGLLWIAHDQGLSRYDGKTFKHFTNPEQSGRGISGLIEDKYGRVWCYNFNAQIFWVKNDVMHLLRDYDASKEIYLPRITICQNELVAASENGVFIYDLDVNKGRYIKFPFAVASVSTVKNKVVLFARGGCYLYAKGYPLVKKEWQDIGPDIYNTTFISENVAKNDTVLAIKGPANWYYRFVVEKNDIRLLDCTRMDSYINTIGHNNNERWIHTKTRSYNLTTGQQISGYNITDVVTDKEGNRWFSSLKNGLMMLPRRQMEINKVHLPLRKGDYIRNTAMMGNKIIYGTQGGDVFSYDTITQKSNVIFSEKGVGSVEHIYVYDSNTVIVSPSVGLYLLNVKTGKNKKILSDMPVKDVSFTNEYTAISSMRGLILMSSLSKEASDSGWMEKTRKIYKGLVDYGSDLHALFWKEERCRASAFASFNKSLCVSYKSGLYQFKADEYPQQITYKGKIINASILVSAGDRIFIGTATDDLLVYDSSGIQLLFPGEQKTGGNMLQLTVVGDQLWIVTTYGIKILNIPSLQVTGFYETPGVNPASIMDVEKAGNNVLVTLPDMVCRIPVSEHNLLPRPIISLAYVTVNGTDTLNEFKNVLKHEESDLRFYLSVPWYSNSEAILIGYRLIGNADTSWQYMPRNDAPVFYASLPPGQYRFEARAFHLLSNYSSDLVSFSFSIKKPWWQSAVFMLLVVASASGIVIYAVRRFYRDRLKRQQQFYEKELAIEKERQTISANIHDELGGTLSGIRLMTEITERKYEEDSLIKEELQEIHSSVSNLTQKLREVIWSLSNENNLLENLLDYLLRRGRDIFVNSPIAFNGQLPEFIPIVRINGEKRRHIYQAVKGALSNARELSNATQVSLRFIIEEEWLTVIITDNRKGIDADKFANGAGISNMKARMQDVNGTMEIRVEGEVSVSFLIPLQSSTR